MVRTKSAGHHSNTERWRERETRGEAGGDRVRETRGKKRRSRPEARNPSHSIGLVGITVVTIHVKWHKKILRCRRPAAVVTHE